MKRYILWSIAVLLMLPLLALFGNDRASADEPYFKNKTIRVIVGSPPGGGYDAYARMLARHMGKHIPGNPRFIVINMPGAGGVIAANYLYNVAKPNGLVFGTFSRGAALLPLFGEKTAMYDAKKFTWLGTSSSYKNDAYVLVIRPELPFKTADELRKSDIPANLGSTGVGSSAHDVALLLKELGLNINLVTGYKGTADMNLAIDRKELDGRTMGLSAIRVSHKDWLEQKKINIMAQFARETRHPDIPDVPTVRELARDKEELALVKFAEMPFFLARPYTAPPGVPPEQAKILREAFIKTHSDPAYLKDVSKVDLDISPKSGEEVQIMLEEIASAPSSVVERYKKILGIKSSSN